MVCGIWQGWKKACLTYISQHWDITQGVNQDTEAAQTGEPALPAGSNGAYEQVCCVDTWWHWDLADM